MSRNVAAAVASAALFTAAGGFGAAAVLGASAAPAKTVTINVATGAKGPPGPPGPKGPPGPPGPAGLTCPASYTAGVLVINHPGGQVSLWTCLKD